MALENYYPTMFFMSNVDFTVNLMCFGYVGNLIAPIICGMHGWMRGCLANLDRFQGTTILQLSLPKKGIWFIWFRFRSLLVGLRL